MGALTSTPACPRIAAVRWRASRRRGRAWRRCLRPPRSPEPGRRRRQRPARRRTATARRSARRPARCRRHRPARARARQSARSGASRRVRLPARRQCGCPRARKSREADQETVVAAAKELRELPCPLDRPPIEPEVGEFGSRHRADDRDLGDRMLLAAPRTACRPRPCAPRRADRPRSRSGASRQRRSARAPGPPRRASPATSSGNAPRRRESPGAAAASARPAATAHASSSLPARGTQIARSPPWRRKSTICCTASWSAKAAATSSTRSFSVPVAAEQHLVGAPQFVDRLMRKAAALQADEIEAGERGAVAERDAERNEVVLDAGKSADEGMRADAHELMRGRAAADESRNRRPGNGPASITLFDRMTPSPMRQSCPTCELARKTQRGPIDRLRAAARRAGIHRHALADKAILADRSGAPARRDI